MTWIKDTSSMSRSSERVAKTTIPQLKDYETIMERVNSIHDLVLLVEVARRGDVYGYELTSEGFGKNNGGIYRRLERLVERKLLNYGDIIMGGAGRRGPSRQLYTLSEDGMRYVRALQRYVNRAYTTHDDTRLGNIFGGIYDEVGKGED